MISINYMRNSLKVCVNKLYANLFLLYYLYFYTHTNIPVHSSLIYMPSISIILLHQIKAVFEKILSHMLL